MKLLPALHWNSRPKFLLLRFVLVWVVICGFYAVPTSVKAALPANRDTSFQTLPMDGLPNATIVLPDGKILIGGNFQTIEGGFHRALARLNTDGTVDDTFNPPVAAPGAFGKPIVSALVRQTDGKIIAAGPGSFITTGAVARTNIIRFNEDGTVDPTFNAGAVSHYSGLTLQADGKLVVVAISGTFKPIRLNNDGSLDSEFNYTSGIQAGLIGLQVQAQTDGHTLLLAGDNNPNSGGISHLLWLKADGSKDTAFKFPFPPNQLEDESRFAVATDGSVLVADIGASSLRQVQRLSADGTVDLAYTLATQPNNQGLYPIPAAFLPDGGSVLVRNPTAGDKRVSFFFLTPTGKLAAQRDLPNAGSDNGVVGVGTLQARAFAMQPDSKLLFAQAFFNGTQNIFGIYRLMPPPVPAVPVITVQPETKSIAAGDSLFLGVTATSESPLTYLWQHAGTNMANQLAQSLGLANNSIERAGDFVVIVGNSFGSVTSKVATVTVRPPAAMVMTQQPVGGSVKLNLALTLFAQCSTEVGTGFQWFKNDLIIPSAAGQSFGSASLSLQANDPNRTGDYFIVFTNTYGGAITSTVVHVEVILPGAPVFTTQPQDQALFASQPVQLSAVATADGFLSYQWQHAGTNLKTSATIGSVTTPQLFIAASDTNRFGEYALVATINPGGSSTSRVASITLQASGLPVLLSQPTSLDLAFGQTTNLSIAFNGEAPLGVSWQHAGTNISAVPYATLAGPATNSYLLTGLPATAGDYRFVATNRFGGVTSTVATISVQLPPSASLLTDLSNVVVGIGEFNFVGLRQGLIVTNGDGTFTTHVLSMNVASGLPPFGGGLPPFITPPLWQLALGASNLFYVGENTGAAAAIGTWGLAPGAPDYLALALTNFPRAGDISRLELFEDGRYGIVLGGNNTQTQEGTYRVLGNRRPATNTFTIDVKGSNAVSVIWLKDGAPLDTKARVYLNAGQVLGPLPSPGGVNSRIQLIIPDVIPSDAGVYSARISNLFPNPDHTFGQPPTIVTSVFDSKPALLGFRGFTETNAPSVLNAFELNSADPSAMAILGDETFLLGTGTTLSLITAQGQTNWQMGNLPAQIRAVVPELDGGAIVGGQNNDSGNFFLNRVHPTTVSINGKPFQTATNVWASTVEGPSTNYFENFSIPHGAEVVGLLPATDGVLVAGRFRGKSRFGATTIGTFTILGGVAITNSYDAAFGSNDRSWDLYLAKYDFAGQLLWVRGYGGTNNETLTTFTADVAGNLYLAGTFQGGAQFGPLAIESTKRVVSASLTQYANDGFVAKLNPDGTPIWVKNFGGLSQGAMADTQILTAAPDAEGNIFFEASRTQASAVLQSVMTVGFRYFARLNSQGDLLWAQTIASTGNAANTIFGTGNSRVVINSSGNAVLVDAYPSILPAVLGAGTVERRVGGGAFLAEVTPGGTLLWARPLDEKLPFADEARTASVRLFELSPAGNLVVAGSFSGGTSSSQTRSAGQRFDTAELYTTNSGTVRPTATFVARLGARFVPTAPILALVSPAAVTGLLQDPLTLEGVASGVPAPSFQWLLNGQIIPGATNRLLTFADLERTNRGSYMLVASNAYGVVNSPSVVLTPRLRPSMTGWTMVGSATNYLGIPARLAADDAGNSYALLIGYANGGLFDLRRFDAAGQFVWQFALNPNANTNYLLSPLAPVVAPSGEVFVAGRLAYRPNLGSLTQVNFLGRLDPADGSFLWVTNLNSVAVGQNDPTTIRSLDLDEAGHVRVIVTDKTVRTFGYDGAESPRVTLVVVPTPNDAKNYRFAFDPSGGFYFYANRFEALNFGVTNFPALSTSGAQSYVLAHFDASGVMQWSKAFPGPGGVTFASVLNVDVAGNVVLAGGLSLLNGQSLQIGTNVLTGSGYTAKVSPNGEVLWAKAWWLNVGDASLGKDGSVYLTGWFRFASAPNGGSTRNIPFGTNIVAGSSITGHDQFIAKLDGDGHEQYIRQTGGPQFSTVDNAVGYFLSVDSRGAVTTAGYTRVPHAGGSLDLGDVSFTWPNLVPFDIANSGGDLSCYYVARLEVGVTPNAPIEITFTPPAAGATTILLNWPPGYHLQRRTSLLGNTWQTLNVVPPYAASIAEFDQAFFQVTSQP